MHAEKVSIEALRGNKLNTDKSEIERAALAYHEDFPAGKVGVKITKDMSKISLAYSPGVAAPCIEINLDPSTAKKYTNIANSIAIVSNGTAVLGLGKLGALASKPVMEGKAALFKMLAGIDCIDIEIEERDPEILAGHIAALEPTFGGINLEDIAAPECFAVESILKSKMKIPVFHDDQHGTAIVVAAAVINSCFLQKKDIKSLKIVMLGAGAAGIACAKMLKSLGATSIIVFDSKGCIHKDRNDLNSEKQEFAIAIDNTLKEAMKNADVFVGTSVAGALKMDVVSGMAQNALLLALANPVPEIYPTEVAESRPDIIVCTGRSDFGNQVNNVLCFPYIFRVALDSGIQIDDHLKVTVANSIADFGRLGMKFGAQELLPKTTDESIRYVMPGLIMSNLAKDNMNPHEYSRSHARRLLPHSNHVLNMSSSHDLRFMPIQHDTVNTDKRVAVELILSAWGYSTLNHEQQAQAPIQPMINANMQNPQDPMQQNPMMQQQMNMNQNPGMQQPFQQPMPQQNMQQPMNPNMQNDCHLKPIDSTQSYSNAIFFYVQDGKYILLHNGSNQSSNVVNALKSKLPVALCCTTTESTAHENVVGVIQNYDMRPICFYNPKSPADELALFSIICSNIYCGNAVS